MILLLILTLFSTPLWAETPLTQPSLSLDQAFYKANELMKEEKFNEAISIYNQMIQSGHQNGYIYFNQGNAYYRLNQIGNAIASYSQAEKLLPRDEDVQANLAYSRSKTIDKIPQAEPSIWKLLFFWLRYMSSQEMGWGLSILVSILLSLTILTKALPVWKSSLKLMQIIMSTLLIIYISSLAYKIIIDDNQRKAVITAPEVTIKSGKSTDSVTLFTLHEGTEVIVTDIQDKWVQISISASQKGWISRDLLAFAFFIQ